MEGTFEKWLESFEYTLSIQPGAPGVESFYRDQLVLAYMMGKDPYACACWPRKPFGESGIVFVETEEEEPTAVQYPSFASFLWERNKPLILLSFVISFIICCFMALAAAVQ